ncbi:PDZ domain-containing protein, partial [Escherichia coli]|nr:PDZ domain-containing protein [Escherichia coli]
MADVLQNGPAAQAGVKVNDKIIKANDEQINSVSHLINYVALQQPGSSITLEVERNGQR